MAHELRKEFIVVVDGDPDVCRTIQRCAWSHGIHADAFTSARDFIGAIESMPAFVPDCVVLDMQLSQLEGFDVLERLGRSRPNTPVIYLTGTIDPGLPQVVPRSESRGFFAKPVDPELFISTLLDIYSTFSPQCTCCSNWPAALPVRATTVCKQHPKVASTFFRACEWWLNSAVATE